MAEFPTWIAVVALALERADGRWLMHRRPPHKHHGDLWEFPGGKVEPGEMPDFALEREIAEELGIAIDRDRLRPVGFARTLPQGGTRGIVILLYKTDRWTGEPQALEGGEIDWFMRDEIPRLAMPPLDVALVRDFFGVGEIEAG